jgi:four helix bundle protein
MAQETKSPPKDLKSRTRDFALRIIRVLSALPSRPVAQVIGRQLLRSGTSVGANYREAIRSRSATEYGAKLQLSLMELEESLYWLELLEASQVFSSSKLAAIKTESSELCAIMVTLINKSRRVKKISLPS